MILYGMQWMNGVEIQQTIYHYKNTVLVSTRYMVILMHSVNEGLVQRYLNIYLENI